MYGYGELQGFTGKCARVVDERHAQNCEPQIIL